MTTRLYREFHTAWVASPPVPGTTTVTIGPGPPPNTCSEVTIKAEDKPVGDGWICHPS